MRSPSRTLFTPSRWAVSLAACVAALATAAALAGLFWSTGEGPSWVTNARGDQVSLYGHGLYRYDSIFAGAGNKGADLVTLALGVPLLVAATVAYARGVPRGGAWLLGAFLWHVYVYASYALGTTAYNELFLVYVAALSCSVYGIVSAYRSMAAAPTTLVRTPRPRRALGWFLLASAVATFLIWISIPISAIATGTSPAGLSHYSTLFTVALDIAILVPAIVIAGVLVLRNARGAVLLAFPILTLEAFLFPTIVLQIVFQLDAGVSLTLPEIIGPVGGFLVLASGACGFLWTLHHTAFAPGTGGAHVRGERLRAAR